MYPAARLDARGFSVRGIFFNPNIHPSTEYVRRRDTLAGWASASGIDMIWEPYRMEDYFRAVATGGEDRCRSCYRLRLDRAASVARELGVRYFSTTLLYSRRQKHDVIRDEAMAAAVRHGVEFLYEDFRGGWQDGIDRSKKLGLYRQRYCGCIFSEKERFYHGP